MKIDGPDSYGRQQWGIFRNGRKPDGAMPRGGRRPTGRFKSTGAENPSLSRLCYRRLWGSRNRRALILVWAYYLDAFSSRTQNLQG
ncbi:hypothetical protein HN873_066005 [Arachis hypogaea]